MTAFRPARRRRVARAAAVGTLLAAVVIGVSACNARETGSAALVGTFRVTETSVNHDATAVLHAFKEQGAPAPATATLLQTLIDRAVDNELVAQAAKREGITITQGQIDTLIDQNGGRAKLNPDFATRDGLWLPPGQIDELARASLIQVALGNKLVPGGDATAIGNAVTSYKAKLAQQLGVSVSPRYGAWDPKTLQISGQVDDLSTPAVGQPLATPTALG